MKALKNKNKNGELLTINQIAELANLGVVKCREIAKNAGAERKIGRCYRVNKQIFFDYIEREYSK